MMRSLAISHRVFPGFVRKHHPRQQVLVRSLTSPLMATYADGARIVHLNHAGASPSPPCVVDRVIEHLRLEQELGGYAAAAQVSDELQNAYSVIARFINASSSQEIAMTESATVAWTRLFYSMVAYQKRTSPRRKIILLSEAEYAANFVACCQWAKDHYGWTVLSIPSVRDKNGVSSGIIDLDDFQAMLNGEFVLDSTTNKKLDPSDIAIVCVTHVPTNSGIVNCVSEMGQAIQEYNTKRQISSYDMPSIFYLVDACQSVGQMPVDVREMCAHGLAATGRKYLRAPRGTGFLYVRLDVCNKLIPSHVDHYCAPVVSLPTACSEESAVGLENTIEYITFREGASRFEFWESSIANRLGLAEAIRYAMDQIGIDVIAEKISERASELRSRLQTIDAIQLHHPESSAGIVTFSIEGFSAEKIKELLWGDNEGARFDVSVVPLTSTPVDSAQCQVKNLLRASVSYTTTLDEIDEFCQCLKSILDAS